MLIAAVPMFLTIAGAAPVNPTPQLNWVVMPAYSPAMPPRDPTLLRTSIPLAQAIADAVEGRVRVASRDERDDHCDPKRGRCPKEIAALVHADRVITMNLSENLDRVAIQVFSGRLGVVFAEDINCEWTGGRPACDDDDFAAVAKKIAPGPLDEKTVRAAFSALRPRLNACRRRGKVRRDAEVHFSLSHEGLAQNVRVEPRRMQLKGAYACMARVVEGLRVPPFGQADRRYFRFSLFTRK